MKDNEWKKKLTAQQYAVLREKSTEAPFSGELLHMNDEGKYVCGACGKVLFNSSAKYDSTEPGLIGWPSFSEVADIDAIKLVEDNKLGMKRTEVTCSNCGGHLGHVFEAGDSPTGTHYCINSVALNFKSNKA
ncbi:MAG: peptide-methionine (R)-S-oxide reductase [Patescibacteria group bacterium]|jgi:peptide-methionine (R)-S-oxide reductase|nr:peptide-methionine (R)-S-oxide reductase [Patescibacteria group bacterium]